MKGDPLPDEHHIVRLVGGSKIDGDIVHPNAFNGQRISVNWLECVDGSKDQQLDRVRSVSRLKLGSTAKFAELEVSGVRQCGKGSDFELDVVEDPLPANENEPAAPCHAEIIGVPDDASTQRRVYAALADNVVRLHDASKKGQS